MSNDFLYNGSVMDDMGNKMAQVKSIIEEAYKMSNDLYSNRLMNTTSWSGESYKTMLAFMNLTLKYHEKFTDAGGQSPVSEAVDALNEMTTNVQGFYDNSDSYKKLMASV
mgnify:CR=1 FL=1